MIYQKGNAWKISGSAQKYATKKDAEKALNGNIEKGHSDRQDSSEWELPESTDSRLLRAAWDTADTVADSDNQCAEQPEV